MIQNNMVFLSGRCTYFKLFEANGQPYTSAWLRVKDNNGDSLLVEVGISEKDMTSKTLEYVKRIMSDTGSDTYVSVLGMLVNKTDKENKTVVRIKTNLRDLEVTKTELPSINYAMMAGDITKQTDRIITLGIPYRDIKANAWKKRNVPVVIPDHSMPSYTLLHRNALAILPNAKRLIAIGSLAAKLPSGTEVVNLVPNTLIPL